MIDIRDFKGIWIPAEVWLNPNLSAIDKIVLAEIDSLSSEEGCYASNEYLAKFCGCSERKISDSISKLVSCGLLTIVSFDGRRRVAKSAMQTRKICEADSQNLLGRVANSATDINSNINSNNIDNNNIPPTPLMNHNDNLKLAVTDWLAYKTEKHQAYKPSGLKSLLSQIENNANKYGDDVVAEVIRDSMASNYMGIMFDRCERKKGNNADDPLAGIKAWMEMHDDDED